jgi:hypothetical protein
MRLAVPSVLLSWLYVGVLCAREGAALTVGRAVLYAVLVLPVLLLSLSSLLVRDNLAKAFAALSYWFLALVFLVTWDGLVKLATPVFLTAGLLFSSVVFLAALAWRLSRL